MFAKTVKYVNYNDQEREKTLLFHLNDAEVLDWLATDGDYTLADKLGQMMDKRDGETTLEFFKDLIYRSYGEKSLDGERFVKSKEVKEAFIESPAYPVFFNEILTDAKKAVEFFVGILPKDYQGEVRSALSEVSKEFDRLEERE